MSKRIQCPSGLGDAGRKEFRRIKAALVDECGFRVDTDMPLLESYLGTYDEIVSIRLAMRRQFPDGPPADEEGLARYKGLSAMIDRNTKTLKTLAWSLGLGAAARNQTKRIKQKTEPPKLEDL